MSDNSLFHIYFDCGLETKEQTYSLISQIACPDGSAQQKADIIHQFKERERIGTPLIAEHVLLPHMESEHVTESQIVICRLAKPIRWNETTEDIRLIITLLLKEHEEEETKKNIAAFTRSLANEDYIDRLLTIENQAEFHQEVIKFREESS